MAVHPTAVAQRRAGLDQGAPLGRFARQVPVNPKLLTSDARQHRPSAQPGDVGWPFGAERPHNQRDLQPLSVRQQLDDGRGGPVQHRLGDRLDLGPDRQRRVASLHQGDHPVARALRHSQATPAQDLLHRQHPLWKLDHAVARRGLGLEEHRRFTRCVRERDAVAAALLGDNQLQRVAHELDRLGPLAGVEHGRVPDQGRDRACRIKEVALLAVPAPRLLADGAERRAVLLRQVVEPGVALVEPLHRDGTAIGPAVLARVRLLSDLDLPRLGIDKPGQALGLPCRLPRGRLRRPGRQECIQALQSALPGLAQLDEPRERNAQIPAGLRKVGLVGSRRLRDLGQDLREDARDQRQLIFQRLEAGREIGATLAREVRIHGVFRKRDAGRGERLGRHRRTQLHHLFAGLGLKSLNQPEQRLQGQEPAGVHGWGG